MNYRIETTGPGDDWVASGHDTFASLGTALHAYAGSGHRIEIKLTNSDGAVCRWRTAPATKTVTLELTDDEIAAYADDLLSAAGKAAARKIRSAVRAACG